MRLQSEVDGSNFHHNDVVGNRMPAPASRNDEGYECALAGH